MAGPLQYDGARFLFQGFDNAGRAIGDALGEIGERKQREKQRQEQENALRAFINSYQQQLGMDASLGGGGGGSMGAPALPAFGGYEVPGVGYQEGGYTWPGAPGEPAGVVHRNEYVVPQEQVEQAGGPQGIRAFLNSLAANPRAASSPGFGQMAHFAEQFERQKEREKKLSTTGKAIKQILKANPDIAGLAGVQPEQLENLGSQDAVALFDGIIQSQAMKQVGDQMRAASDFAAFTQGVPGARQMAPTDPRLGQYYDTTADEMPERPGRGISEYLPELAARHPRAAQHNNFNDYVKMLQPAAGDGWNLRPGQMVDYGGRRGMAVSPNSLQLDTPEKDEKTTAGNYDWLTTDDAEEFKRGLKSIKDPEERDRVLDVRAKVLRASGREDPMAAVLAAILNGGKPPEKAKPADKPAVKSGVWTPQGIQWNK
jgi:hypothetical protein